MKRVTHSILGSLPHNQQLVETYNLSVQSSPMGTSLFPNSPLRIGGPIPNSSRVLFFLTACVQSSVAGVASTCRARTLMIERRQLRVHSVEKDSQPEYELDQEKALQALNELDQQFDSLLNKPAPKPKIQASNLPDTLRDQMKGEEPVFSGPSLAYGAFVLFIFTIFYNIIFYSVIKPSIDIS